MKKVTVEQLKAYLQEVLNDLDNFDDQLEVPTVSNTYFIHSNLFMQFGSAGFVDLENLYDDLQEAECTKSDEEEEEVEDDE